jgi:hypothetical protein
MYTRRLHNGCQKRAPLQLYHKELMTNLFHRSIMEWIKVRWLAVQLERMATKERVGVDTRCVESLLVVYCCESARVSVAIRRFAFSHIRTLV